MSGLEVAGLILGAIPLLISAIEHYNDGLDPLKGFIQWKGRLDKAIRELWHEKTVYCQTTQNLLRGATTPEELNAMLEDPSNHLWSDNDLKAKLQDRLSYAYQNYIATTEEIEKIVTVLSGHLDLDKARVGRTELEALVLANPPTPSGFQKVSSFQFRRRINFTMKRREVMRMLENFKACNERLEGFLDRAEKLDEVPTSRFKCVFALPLARIEDHASRISETFARAWCCNVHTTHCANVLLEHRILEPIKRRINDDKNIKFTFAISDPSQLDRWANMEIGVSFPNQDDQDLSHERSSNQRKTRFTIATPSTSTLNDDIDVSSLPEIDDICATMSKPRQVPDHVGFHIDAQKKLRGPYAIKSRLEPYEDFVALEKVLFQSNGSSSRGPRMSQRDCYLLAINLTSSLLQLHTTSWIARSWTKKDIVFPRMATSELGLDVQRPFLGLSYSSPPPNTSVSLEGPEHDRTRLMNLGTMLLEIFCDQRMEDRRQEDPMATQVTSDISDLDLLLRWTQAKEKDGNLSFGSKEAISNCLACFADPRTNLRDSAFRQALVDKIVTPLVVEWRHWQGIF